MSSRVELPFLYCTRTILRPFRRKQFQAARRLFHQSLSEKSTSSNQAEQTQQEELISFLKQKAASVSERINTRHGTSSNLSLTPAERQAFRRFAANQDKLDKSSLATAESVSDTDASRILEMFKSAASSHKHEQTNQSGGAVSPNDWTTGFRRALTHKNESGSDKRIFDPISKHSGLEDITDVEYEETEDEVEAREEELIARGEEDEAIQKVTDSITRVQLLGIAKALEDALTTKEKRIDLAIWEVCQSQIFPLVTLLRKRNTFQIKPTDDNSKDNLTTSRKAPDHPILRMLAENEADLNETSETNFKLHPLPVISFLYPASLLLTQRLLLKHAPTSPFANTLLPQIRSLGPTSYVLGANTHFYNTVLTLKWRVYNDMPAIDGLLAEMERSGLEMDLGTLKVLNEIEEDRRTDIWTMMKDRKEAGNQNATSATKPLTQSDTSSIDIMQSLNSMDFQSRSMSWWTRPETSKWFSRMREWKEIVSRRLIEKGVKVENVIRDYGDDLDPDLLTNAALIGGGEVQQRSKSERDGPRVVRLGAPMSGRGRPDRGKGTGSITRKGDQKEHRRDGKGTHPVVFL